MPQMTGSKLNPIYTALDSHQYNRAIKLAAALPDSNTLGKALLAHAYSKSGQKHQALIALQIVLGNFCELQLELEASVQASPLRQQSKVPPLQDQKISSKKGKKGKKKQITVVAKEQVSPSNEKEVSFIDRLDNQPSLPQKWEELPSPEMAIIDEVRQILYIECCPSKTTQARSFPFVFLLIPTVLNLDFAAVDYPRHFVCYASEYETCFDSLSNVRMGSQSNSE